MRLANERESNETSGARVPWLVQTLHETSKGLHRDERPSSIPGEVGAVAPKRSAAKSGEEKMALECSFAPLVHRWLKTGADQSRGENQDPVPESAFGGDGLSTLRVIERLSLPSDTLVGGCPWRCSGTDLHVESREQSWRRPPVTPCGSLCARCAPVAAKLLRESLTCCFHTTRDSSDASVTHA